MSPSVNDNASTYFQDPQQQYGAPGPRLGPRLDAMDGKGMGGVAERQFYCPPQQPYMQGCYMGEFFPQSSLQFQAPPPPILSTSPKMGAAPKERRGSMARQQLERKDAARQPVPPGYVMPQQPMGGFGGMAATPMARGTIQDFCAPSAALGLLEAETGPRFEPFAPAEGPVETQGGRRSRDQSGSSGDLPAPLLVRNTFLCAKPVRSPSLDPFFEERKVKSSPPSRPHSGKLEVAVPRAMPSSPPANGRFNSPICSLFDALMHDSEGGRLPDQVEQAPPLPGIPTLRLSEDLCGPATPELSFRESPWQPMAFAGTPLVGTGSGGKPRGCAGSSSGGSAEMAASLVSTRCSTAVVGADRPEAGVALGSAELPSRGSALHQWGACKPCAFVFQEGCKNDTECQFCHLCEPGERKRRKKERLAMKREVREDRRRRQEAGSAMGGWRPRPSAAER